MTHRIEFESRLDQFTQLASLIQHCEPDEVLEWIEQIWRAGKIDGHIEASRLRVEELERTNG